MAQVAVVEDVDERQFLDCPLEIDQRAIKSRGEFFGRHVMPSLGSQPDGVGPLIAMSEAGPMTANPTVHKTTLKENGAPPGRIDDHPVGLVELRKALAAGLAQIR